MCCKDGTEGRRLPVSLRLSSRWSNGDTRVQRLHPIRLSLTVPTRNLKKAENSCWSWRSEEGPMLQHSPTHGGGLHRAHLHCVLIGVDDGEVDAVDVNYSTDVEVGCSVGLASLGVGLLPRVCESAPDLKAQSGRTSCPDGPKCRECLPRGLRTPTTAATPVVSKKPSLRSTLENAITYPCRGRWPAPTRRARPSSTRARVRSVRV